MIKAAGVKIQPENGSAIIQSLLKESHSHKVETPSIRRWSFFDTFDWRLYNRSLTLLLEGNNLSLRKLQCGDMICDGMCSSIPNFAQNLPSDSLSERLNSIIEERSVLLLASVNVQNNVIRILNKDQKTVAVLNLTNVIFDGIDAQKGDSYISVQAIRGYPKYHSQLTDRIKDIGAVIPIYPDIYHGANKKQRLSPGSYSNQLELDLDPDASAKETLQVILIRLLEIMRANEAGIKADIDTEFLHDYRVAIRKTRSLLSQIKQVLPKSQNIQYRKYFAGLGSTTNELRDLDVYLLSEGSYMKMLPGKMKAQIHPLFLYLSSLRKKTLDHVISTLESDEYKLQMQEYKAFLNSAQIDPDEALLSQTPAIELARYHIYKQYRRVVKDGRVILKEMQDEMLHELRLECKKLRYLLEFFSSLFPQNEITRMIKQLKKLQENLGEFNDLSVQQDYLIHLASRMPIKDEDTKMALIATGYLIDRMAQRQVKVKANFSRTFRDFISKENLDMFRKLFHNQT